MATALAVLAPMVVLASSAAPAPAGGSPSVAAADTTVKLSSPLHADPPRPKVVGVRHGTTTRTPAGKAPKEPVRIVGPQRMGPAAATFAVTYSAGYPTQAKAAFQAAVDTWAAAITSTQPIHINAAWTNLGDNITLGATSIGSWVSLSNGSAYPVALAEALCACEVPDVPYEMSITFNSQFPFYQGTDGNTPVGQYDLETITLHEIGHGLGWASLYNVVSGVGSWATVGDSRARYDDLVYSALTGGSRLNDTAFVANNSTALATQLTDGSVYFAGSVATFKNGGVRPRLWAPATFKYGTSTAHVDPTSLTGADRLMAPSIGSATAYQVLTPLTLGVMEDLGWVTSIVDPDPPTWTGAISPSTPRYYSVATSVSWIWAQASDPIFGLRPSPYYIELYGAVAQVGGTCGAFSTLLASGYTSQLQLGLSSGTPGTCYRLSVRVVDRHGNSTPTVVGGSITYDTAPPVVSYSITESAPNISVSGTTVSLKAPPAGQTFSVNYTLVDISPVAVGCTAIPGFTAPSAGTGTGSLRTCTYTATGSGYAAATVTAQAGDDAFNLVQTPAFSVALDTIAPTTLVTLSENAPTLDVLGVAQLYVGTPPAGATFTATYTATETGSGVASITCPAVSGFTSQAGGTGSVRTCTYTATGSGYAAGTAVGVATDNVGNSANAQSFSITRDTTPPTVGVALQFLNQPALFLNQQTLFVGTPAAGSTYVASYSQSDAGSGLAAMTCPSVAGFTASLNINVCTYTAAGSGYGTGSTAVTATIADRVGNTAQASYTLTRDTTPPTATVTPYDVEPAIHVSGTTAFVGTPPSGRNLSATYQITETGSGFASITCPAIAGFSLNGSIGTSTTQDCVWLSLGSGYASGVATVTLRDNVGNTGPASFTVTRDAIPPTLTFSNAGAGTVTRTVASVDLQWQESDGGAGVQGRSLQRQRAAITSPGQCPGAGGTWTNEGAPITGGSPATVSSLADASCYRWVATIVDNVTNSGSSTSPTYLIDLGSISASVTLGTSAPGLHVDGTTLYVGSTANGEQFTATYGVTGGTASSVTCPTVGGFSAAAGPGDLVCTYTATGSGYAGGGVPATVTDTLSRQAQASFTVVLDTTAPAIAFTAPQAALSLRNGSTVDLAWTESETGSGVASRRLQQQVATIVTPGTCDGVSWADDGAAVAGGSPKTSDTLADGACYRWVQTTKDQVGNTGTDTSGRVLIDRTAPDLVITLGSTAAHIEVSGTTVTLGELVAGEQFTATVGITETASGFAGLTCPDIAGFTKDKSGAAPTIVCTWTATGSGYAAASPQVSGTDGAGNGGTASFSVALDVGATVDPLPAGWASRDIGTVGVAGSAGVLQPSGAFQATGAGRGFSGTTDSFRLTSRAMSGDGSFAARILTQAAPTTKSLVGVMVRQDATGTARFVFIGRRSDGTLVVIRRSAVGGAAVTTTVTGVSATLPVEVRIKRTGNVFLAQYRLAGGTWKKAASATVTMAAATRAGIAVTSRSTTASSTVTWDTVTFVP